MKASKKWLNEYVDCLDIPKETLEERFTMTGTKVESVEEIGKFKGVVVGKIIEITPHENAERLVVTKVDVKKEVVQIVTGATNVNVGDIIPVALVGSILPNGIEIKKGALRGVESFGMMCSIGELNLDKNFLGEQVEDGIMQLPKSYIQYLGEPVEDVFNIHDEIYDFEITPNRPDCQGIIGIAKELAASVNRKMKENVYIDENTFKETFKTTDKFELEDGVEISANIEDDNTNRYMMLVLNDIQVEESPSWLKNRLKTMGVEPKNNIVDITNYIMFETGQPVHAFDIDKIVSICGKKVVFNSGSPKEDNIELLKEEYGEISLNGDEMIISANGKNLALAGIMGGKTSMIDENTKRVCIEIANFKRKKIREVSRRLNIRTEASSRFEKNLPISLLELTAIRLKKLITETISCGSINEIIDIKKKDEERNIIKLDDAKINRILGLNISKEEMVDILKQLEFDIFEEKEETFVKAPYLRNDVSLVEDLAEEIIRFYGYDKLQNTLPQIHLSEIEKDPVLEIKNELKTSLVLKGYNEIITYGFISKEDISMLGLKENNELLDMIEVLNPLGDDYKYMRTTHIPSILKAVSLNEKRQNENLKLFEIAKVFKEKQNLKENTLPKEENILTCVFTAKKEKKKEKQGSQMDYITKPLYSMKKDIINVLYEIGFRNYILEEEHTNEIYHPYQCVNFKVGKDIVGVFGKIHPRVIKNFDILQDVYVFECNLEKVSKYARKKEKYTEISKFPKVYRDLSIVVDKDVKYAQIEEVVKKYGKPYFESVSLFDIYISELYTEDEKSFKSISITIELKDKKKTLSEEEINTTMNNIISGLEKVLNAKLRA